MPAATTTRAQDLVYTSNYVEGDMSVGDVKSWFQTQISVVSLGVINKDETFGLITRNHLSQQLIGQMHKPSFLQQPVSDIMIAHPLVVEAGEDLDAVVMKLLTQKSRDEEFFHDIIVRDAGRFVGLISVRDLLVNHFENLTHKFTAMEAQFQSLVQRNKELFANSFRVGHQEGHLKQIIEAVPVPIALFTDDGRLAFCNPRFLELLEYTPKTLGVDTRFKDLFDDAFHTVHQLAVKNWELAVHDDRARCIDLTGRTRGGDPVNASAYVELMPDGRHFCLTLVHAESRTAEEPARREMLPDVTPVESPTRPLGKVTQAIRVKLSNENAQGLARTVATTLIDRDDSLDKLMKKVEAIIKVTEEIEQTEPPPAPMTDPESAHLPNPDRPPLRGALADFSLIDLCQILVQGTKTGHLRIRYPNGRAGDVFFYCGTITHASTDDGVEGLDALPSLMREKSNGRFEFNFDLASPQRTIEGDPMGILMDACRIADETPA